MRHCTAVNDTILQMKDLELLPEVKRKKYTKLFVSCIAMLAAMCIGIMNFNYDRLARYPYKDENSRRVIKQHLSDEEIEYIITYSIPPNMFIAFIDEPGFSIYHCAEYKKLSNALWYETPQHIVQMVEETRNQMDTDQLIAYLGEGNYIYENISFWLNSKDDFNKDSTLVTYAGNLDAYPDPVHSVSDRIPQNLVDVPSELTGGREVRLRDDALNGLQAMCASMSSELGSAKSCAAMQVQTGFVSYESQKDLYEADPGSYEMPGHDEHQLGLAVDFAVPGLSDAEFEKTIQSEWLTQNAWRYGYVLSRTEDDSRFTGLSSQPWHYRFVGTDLAQTLHSSNITFGQYKAGTK